MIEGIVLLIVFLSCRDKFSIRLKRWDKFSSRTKASSKGTVGSTHTLLCPDASSSSSPLLIVIVAKNSKGNKSGRIIGALCWGPDWLRRFYGQGSLKTLSDIIFPIPTVMVWSYFLV
jgi:hypothetical protein